MNVNFKVLALGAVLGFAVAVAPACGGSKCDASNCKNGCCDPATNKCISPGNTNTQCGNAGAACVNCGAKSPVQVCGASFTCVAGTGTGGGGGSTGGGTGG